MSWLVQVQQVIQTITSLIWLGISYEILRFLILDKMKRKDPSNG